MGNALDFGDGDSLPQIVLGLAGTTGATGKPTARIEGAMNVYRGSFAHSYPSAGTYTITAKLTPDGEPPYPGVAPAANSAFYPPSTGVAYVGTLTNLIYTHINIALTTATPYAPPLLSSGNAVTNFYPGTVRTLVNTSGPIMVDEIPEVKIDSPRDGSNFGETTTIEIVGSAFDLEDGDLTASMTWTSDLDGAIGAGGVFLTTLSPGLHTITATAADSFGNVGTASVMVNVAAGGPVLAATAGFCPGMVTLKATGMAPGDKVAFFTSELAGVTQLGGACLGAVIDLDAAVLRSRRFADAAGEITVSRFFPPVQCNLLMQVINLGVGGSACQTSNVLPAPVPPPPVGVEDAMEDEAPADSRERAHG